MKRKFKKYTYLLKIRFLELIQRYFPFNSVYRPKGIYFTSKEFISAVQRKQPQSKYVEIYSNVESSFDIADDFYKACFKAPKQAQTTFVVTAIEKGRIYSNHGITIAIISEDNHLIGDVSFAYNYGRVATAEENIILTQKYFKKPTYYKGVVFSMLSGQGAIHNYGHWLIDTLPRLHLLKESGWFDKVDWFLVPNYQHDYQKDSLKLAGIDESKIINGNQYLHLQADILLASTAPRGTHSILPQWCCNYLREAFLTKAVSPTRYPALVYISRRDSAIRRVVNEEQVIALLETYGFKTYTLSSLPLIEKIKLFASAQVIVSAAGAGMANTVFCKKGAKVLEIFGETLVHPETYDKANKTGVDYYYLLGNEEKEFVGNFDWKVLNEHVTVDINKLQQKLEKYIIHSVTTLVEN